MIVIIEVPAKLEKVEEIDELNFNLYQEIYSSNQEVVIDLSQTSFTYPFGMVSLLVGLENLSKHKNIKIDFNKTPNVFLSYIERMNFFEYLPSEIVNDYDLSYLKQRKRNNLSEVLLEITKIEKKQDVYKLTDCLYQIFHNKVSTRVTTNIISIVTELANNILDHSESTGYVAVQYYKSNIIRMAIIDDGVGIVNKFKSKVQHINEPLRILKKAFKIRNSTRENMLGGRGLRHMRESSYDEMFSSTTIHLKTGENIYSIEKDNIILLKETTEYRGTYYDFTIKID